MKFLSIFLLFFTLTANASEKKDFLTDTLPDSHPTVVALKNLNLQQFQGNPIDTLLAHLPNGITSMRIANWGGYLTADALIIKYASDSSLRLLVHVKDFEHMDPKVVNTSTPFQNWDISLMRKEKVAWVIVYSTNRCINGCEHEK